MKLERVQLYKVLPDDHRIVWYVTRSGAVITIPSGSMPVLFWPDGSWCLEANSLLQKLRVEGRKAAAWGGTLTTYASQMSHIIRFCWNSRICLSEVTDDDLFDLAEQLKSKGGNGQRKRNDTTVSNIGSLSVKLVKHAKELHFGEVALAPVASVDWRVRSHRLRPEKAHLAFKARSPSRRRVPISSASISRLRAAALNTKCRDLRRRRLLLLSLLEFTGARRTELANITVLDVERAVSVGALRLTSLKRRDQVESRELPISTYHSRLLLDYVRGALRPILKRYGVKLLATQKILVNIRSGIAIDTRTISKEISLMRESAGIDQQTCAHMFRHRFITNSFILLMQRENLRSIADFKRMFIDVGALKDRVKELVGLKLDKSLDHYVHAAFSEVTGSQHAQAWQDRDAMQSEFFSELTHVLNERSGDSALANIRQLVKSYQQDLLKIDLAAGRRRDD